jgi:predicted glycosyl hydrolase (DUF1957 family)
LEESTALQQRIIETHELLTHSIAGLDDATLESEPAVGDWTVREVAGHLADWIDESLRSADIALSGGQVDVVDGEAFNLAGVAQHAGDSWAETQLRLGNALSEAIALVSRLEPGQLELPTAFPWGGAGTLERLLGGVVGHHVEHIEELADWRAGR